MTTAAVPSPSLRAQRLVFDGQLTIYDAGVLKTRLQAALEQAGDGGLELDLDQVSEIDTAGLQLLLLARRESRRLQRPLRIVAASAALREVVGFCRLGDFFGETLPPDARD
ncbi:STAS domain-containing protein [Parapusillimonas granuli]|uniref:STAS domain-containing protein n=1 Tax=Parapusillimonas granuli TaxID=380911 RepID=A0A853G1E6_9BURK|nr:STAS domain-containing protein [Parapusillimonas granuli]MBB5213437.1 anti-anti-sigma factor [Parapusillimonas granuli]NYT48276.1 STAS domain-containing protein [Parapusillimonas granuli]